MCSFTCFIERTTGYVPALAALASIDAALGRLLPQSSSATDDISGVADALAISKTLARGTVVAVPEPETDQEAAVHASLMRVLQSAAEDPRVAVVQLSGASTDRPGGLSGLAIARQLETPVRSFMTRDANNR